jgi:aspartate carbamoyltransferase catalytic subunit
MMAAYHYAFAQKRLLTVEGLSRPDLTHLLDLAEAAATSPQEAVLRGRRQVHVFFAADAVSEAAYELAGRSLGAEVVSLPLGEGATQIDAERALKALQPDIVVMRHAQSGAALLLAQKLDCAFVNASDGAHEAPVEALHAALTIFRARGRIEGLTVALCGDVLHSALARSAIIFLAGLGARLRVVGPSTLLPSEFAGLGVEMFTDLRLGLKDVDIVMPLPLSGRAVDAGLIASPRDYFHGFGLDAAKMAFAKPDALVLHPGPITCGVEIDSAVADGPNSLIAAHAALAVPARMAVLAAVGANLPAV